eukprot:3219855-Amphidinium_carterae.2
MALQGCAVHDLRFQAYSDWIKSAKVDSDCWKGRSADLTTEHCDSASQANPGQALHKCTTSRAFMPMLVGASGGRVHWHYLFR